MFLRLDAEERLADRLGHAVNIGVLNQRLQDESGHHGVEHLGFDGYVVVDYAAKANLLDRQIQLNEFNLIFQTDELGLASIQRHTQHAAHLFQHSVGSFHIDPHERRNTVHRIEEEVRMKLHSKRTQASLGQLPLEAHLGVLLLAKLLVVAHTTKKKEDDPENHQIVDDFRVEVILETLDVRPGRVAQR